MSQTSGYQYQTYGDPNNPLKTELTPMVNDQATRNLQNGLQSPHYNLTGVLSSQSSRDPSRETSRDPSPTQYLHNQYRPQLPRPPMPPINGQQNMNLNVISPPPRMPQVSQYSSTAIPYNNQFGSNAMHTMPSSDASTVPPTFGSQSPNVQLNHGSGVQAAVSTAQSEALQSHSSSDVPPGVMTKKDVSLTQNYQWLSNPKVANVSLNASNTSASNNADSPKKQNQIPGQTPLNPPYNQINKTIPQTLATAQNQIPLSTANITQPSSNGNQPLHQNSQVLQNTIFPNTTSPRNLSQTGFESQTKSLVSPESVPAYASQPKFGSQQNIHNSIQSTQSTTQSMSSMHNLGLSKSQSMSGSQHFGAQDYPLQTKVHQSQCVHSQMQSSTFNNQIDSQNLGPTSRQSQNIYGSQPNLASQKRYPPNPYGTQLPPNTANFSNSGSSGVRPNAPPGNTQYQVRPTPGMLPGQQMYSGQMSNVPLDSMTKRYPSSYPDQMNQLNNQMSNMTVTQTGYNKLWGMESVDLLQCRNVLPPERVEPPKIRLHQEFLDGVNCSPDIFRCTLTKIPESNSLLQKSRLPLGILIHPFKDLNHLPVIQCSTIVRCRACRAYINPFIYFVDSKRWKCNLCYRVNELPEEFQFDPVTKSYGDPSRRPEVKTSTIEFIAPGEYMLRPPQPAVYLFILDVSRLAVESGYLTIVCNVIAEELSRLPGDGRTQIGFLAVDSAIHFFSMPDNVSQPHEMIMLDVDDVFLPCPENLIVNLKEREELVRDLLAQLPTKFQETHDTNCALGAGLQAAYKLMSPTGGRVTVFQTCLPNLGPGMLQPREDPNNRANKDVPHLNPATDFYKRLALDCNGQQIAVDLFLLNSQYSDLATLSGMCKFSGGCIYHIPLFRVSKSQSVETLEKILRRYLTRKIGFEAVMRIRCTRGLSIHTFHGNFFVRSTDLLTLPNINPDAGFGMQISIEENLSDIQNVCFQAALLYTSSKGERRIRVHTLCLPVISSLSDILYSADQQCIVGLLCKMAVDRSQQSSLSDARDALINVAIDVLSAYKLSQSMGSAGLLAPGSLKLLPLYIIALLKCIAFRSGTSTRLDDRVFAMCQLKTLPLFQLIQMIYPDLYPIHALDDRNSKDIDGKVCPQPPRLHLSAEKLDSRGAFLMDAGDKIFIYIGKNIHPSFCYNILGVPAFASIPEELYELPELDTVENERLRNFIFSLQEEKPFCASVQIIRDDSHFRTLFVERLIEDRFESALSYYEFLQHLKTQVK